MDRQMDRYELVEGKSSKFWEVGVDGATLTVTFGRIGTDGQTKAKDFADAAAAAKEKDKLVREKTGKGYALVGSGGAAEASKTAAAPVKASTSPTKTSTSPTKTSASIAKAKAPKAAAELPETEPEVHETQAPEPSSAPAAEAAPGPSDALAAIPAKETRGLLFDATPLPTRTRPGHHIDAEAAWAQLRERLGPLLPDDGHAEWVPRLRELLAGPPPHLDAEAATGWMQAIEAALELTPQDGWNARGRWLTAVREGLDAFARVLVETSGARIVAEVAARLLPDTKSTAHFKSFCWSAPLHLALRAALVQAPEGEYDDAVAVLVAKAEAAADWPLAVRFAFILADDRPAPHTMQPLAVLEAAAAAGVDFKRDHTFLPLIADVPPAAAARWRPEQGGKLYLIAFAVGAAEAAATLMAVAAANGAAALPSLDWYLGKVMEEHRTIVATAMLETREPGAVAALLPVLQERWIRPAFDAAGEAYPAWMFTQCLGALAAGRTEPALRGRVADTIDRFGADQARGWALPAGAEAQAYLAKLIATRDVPLAEAAHWPRVLRAPPWRQTRAKDDIVVDLAPIATPLAFDFPEVEPDYWRGRRAHVLDSLDALPAFLAEAEAEPHGSMKPAPEQALPRDNDYAVSWLERRIKQIHESSYYMGHMLYAQLFCAIERQPEPVALALWALTGPLLAMSYRQMMEEAAAGMVRRFGEKAVPGLLKAVEAAPISVLPAVLPVDEAGIAPLTARALLKLKKARVPALAWLRLHRETAMTRLVPDAVGKPGAIRDAAEHALRVLVADRDDGRAALDAVVARYAADAPRVAEAMTQVLDRDPLGRVPSKVGKPPAWAVPSALARPRLRDVGALPDAAVLTLCEMLSFVNPDEVYAGIAQVKEACTPDSLAAFAWDLFSAWIAAGAPSKDGWALRAIGWLGDDSCARELTRLIRRWPGEAAHARAVTGLDVLADIGTDVALMNLNGIAEKLKFKGLQEKARAKIAVLAEARGLSPEELSDRLAPDLDLDESGGLDLDFGPRSFRAGFDELLKPWVKDATGQRLKDLPKPIKSDDAEKGAAAVARWAALKKDARAVATLQLNRLEAMLATSRRVRPEVFQLFFAAHPLVRHLAQRLVWATFADADPRTGPDQAFRVAEDLSFTDADDAPIEIDVSSEAAGLIGLLHPLHLGADALVPWGTLFGDYEITQPFPQLGRETFAFTPAEAAVGDISRFDGVEVESARVRGMGARGWPLGTLADHGVASWIEREVAFPDGTSATVSLMFENGIFAGARDAEDATQTLRRLSFDNHWTATQARGTHIFGALDPVTASELLRGPSLLAGTRVT